MHGVEERAPVYCPAQGQGCGGDALDTSPDMAQEGLETPQRNKIPAQLRASSQDTSLLFVVFWWVLFMFCLFVFVCFSFVCTFSLLFLNSYLYSL